MKKQGERCIIISGGEEGRLPADIQDCFVIACDRGYAYALRQGVKPNLLISDYDSYDGPVAADVPVEKFRSEKDDTDTMLAVKAALAQGFQEIVIYCGLGGRLDHLYANLQAVVYGVAHGARCSLWSEDTQVYGLCDGQMEIAVPSFAAAPVAASDADGAAKTARWSLSVFAVSDQCRGVSLSGVKYPLTEATLTNSFPLGVSNEFATGAGGGARIAVKTGTLLVMVCRA